MYYRAIKSKVLVCNIKYSKTTFKVLAIVWVQNRHELNDVECKYIRDNREFLINKKNIKSLEEKKKEFNLYMKQYQKKKYDNIPYVTCSLCNSKVKQTRMNYHKTTKLCNRRSEILLV